MTQALALNHFHDLLHDLAADTNMNTVAMNTVAIEASAPGRVNLIGEHTDYSGGYVLPLALERRTWVALAINQAPTGTLHANSQQEGKATADLNAPASNLWTDYLVGAVRLMNELGAGIDSLTIGLASDVPLGAGVSSSAALEVSVLRALRTACHLTLSDTDLAYVAQRIENEHLGLQTGIMDQMAASLGTPGAPLFFDTHTGLAEPLPMFSDACFLTFHSGVSRRLVEGAYNERRAATDLALQTLNLERLVQVSPAQIAQLPAAIHPRVRHVTTENERVLAAVAALKGDQPEIFARLMNAAHASMRDDFAASHDDVDAQVAAALRAGAMGARITGAGFGGCYVALSRPDKVADICADLLAQFPFAKRVA